MILYWVFFLVVAVSCFFQRPPNLTLWGNRRLSPLSLIFISLCLIIGFRFETGGDWGSYLRLNQYVNNLELLDSFVSDIGYDVINWAGANIYGGIFFPNLVCAAIFCSGLKRFCDGLPNPSLGLIVALPYLVWIVAIGYTRQAAAVGGFMWAISFLRQERWLAYLCFSFISIFFHKTAVFLLLFTIFPMRLRFGVFFFLILIAVVGVFLFLGTYLLDKILNLLLYFSVGGMQSSGALVRLLMTAFCAVGSLYWISCFRLSDVEKRFWKVFSGVGLLFIPMFFIIPSTTVIDRLLIYWLPLQVLFLSHFPTVCSTIKGNSYRLATLSVILLSASIQWTWFLHSESSHAWIPYRFYPWEWFWSI